jgi:hypothetical protein
MSAENSYHFRSIPTIIITVATALVFVRIAVVAKLTEADWSIRTGGPVDSAQMTKGGRNVPIHSDNDRSRWVTVRALLERGTYVIGKRDPAQASMTNPHGDIGLVFEPGWTTIDKVLDPDTLLFYSSKPPLLPTLVAGLCWALQNGLGWHLTDPSSPVVGVVLLVFNWLPFAVYLILLSRLLSEWEVGAWCHLYILSAAAFATFVTTFAVTLNNHTVAACGALVAVYSFWKAWSFPYLRRLVGMGFWTAFAATMELPAACLVVILLGLATIRWRVRGLIWFLVGAALPAAGFLGTNAIAVGRFMPVYSEFGGPWYQYPGSYWNQDGKPKHGIDWADEDKPIYAFHLLLGHHGLFSLTPIFILSLVGIVAAWTMKRDPAGSLVFSRFISIMLIGAVPIVIGFYVWQTNNYGGYTAGPRWLMWLTPLLLLALVPALKLFADSRAWRGLAYLLLALSVISANYHVHDPWRHPWLLEMLQNHGWVRY